MHKPASLPAQLDELTQEAKASDDSAAVADLYTRACDLLQSQAAQTSSRDEKAALIAYSLWLAQWKSGRLVNLALDQKDYKKANQDQADRGKTLVELHDFLVEQAALGSKPANVDEEPEWYLAYRDESDANFLVDLLAAEGADRTFVEQRLIEKVRGAATRYENLDRFADVADCYETLADFYFAVNDFDSYYRNAITAADKAEHASERDGITADESNRLRAQSLKLRVTANQLKGAVLSGSFAFGEAHELWSAAIGWSKELTAIYDARNDTSASQGLNADCVIFEALDLYAQAMMEVLRTGAITQAAAEKFASSKEKLGGLDEISAGETYQMAVFLMAEMDLDLTSLEMVKFQLAGDWNGAEACFDRAVRAADTAKSHAPNAASTRIVEFALAMVVAQRDRVSGERAFENYDFTRAASHFAQAANGISATVAVLEAGFEAPMQATFGAQVAFSKGLASFCRGREHYSNARLLGLTGNRDAATAELNRSIGEYAEARGPLAAAEARGEGLRRACVRQGSEAETFRGFLEEVQRSKPPRLTPQLEMKSERCKPRDNSKIKLTVHNSGDTIAQGVRCTVDVPADFSVTRLTGLARADDSTVAWDGSIGSDESRAFHLFVRAPDTPGLYTFTARCEYVGGAEESSADIEVQSLEVHLDLGLVTLNLTEARLFWLKVAAYPVTLILGAIIGALFTHFFLSGS